MLTKEAIKARFFLDGNAPRFPLGEFVEWAERQHERFMLEQLELIQEELAAEERAFREGNRPRSYEEAVRLAFATFYCAQVRGYYREICEDPANKQRLAFLRQTPRQNAG